MLRVPALTCINSPTNVPEPNGTPVVVAAAMVATEICICCRLANRPRANTHARTPACLARLFVVIYSCASAPSQEPTNARVELCSVSAVQTLHCMMCRAKCVIVNSVCTHAFGETHTHICRNSSARPLLNLTVTLTTESTEPDRGSPGVMLAFFFVCIAEH